MFSIAKYLTGGVALLAVIIIGFLAGIRSCLSEYDQRYALPGLTHVEKDGKTVLFSLVKYQETTSCADEGGIINKTFSNTYFVQCNDAASGQKIIRKEIEGIRTIKNFPVEVMGATPSHAWIFLDGPIVFDPFTLEKIADAETIEKLNPSLKGNLPAERQYFHFNDHDENIALTARDGSRWLLNASTLLAVPDDTVKPAVKYNSRDIVKERWKNLQHPDISYNQMMVNQDTAGGQWLGLYSGEEAASLSNLVTSSVAYGQAERRRLFTGRYTPSLPNKFLIDANAGTNAADMYFLDGGFLLDKQTGQPIHPGDYFIIYKSQVGHAGSIVLCRVSASGKKRWTFDTGVPNWINWIYTGKRMIITAHSNAAISGSECNLLSVDCNTGGANRYDFAADKTISTNHYW